MVPKPVSWTEPMAIARGLTEFIVAGRNRICPGDFSSLNISDLARLKKGRKRAQSDI
jgi:hypothetical protein